jgi:2C-methyl-D-erythritol 2,4-cyclodiphosphate synthase
MSNTPQSNTAGLLLHQSRESIQTYVSQKKGKIYELYKDNVNPLFSELEFILLEKHVKRVIAISVYQNNKDFIACGKTPEIQRKRKNKLRKCLVELLDCHRSNMYEWLP